MKTLEKIIINAVKVSVQALGMHWENVFRDRNGDSIAYGEESFIYLLRMNPFEGDEGKK